MINTTGAFKQALFNDNRQYLEYADITLFDGTVLNLTNKDLWQNGMNIEDSIGSDNSFDALGAAVVNSAALVINNIYDDYSDYDFTNATVVLYVGLELPNGDTTRIEKLRKGTFRVDEAKHDGAIITLKSLDYMEQFDRPYSNSTLTYPASLDAIVRDACTRCGITLATLDFPHKNYEIATRPTDEATTFREVISWCATIAGCFARCNTSGQLELKWFSQAALESRTEGTDGGTFDDGTPRYSTGDNVEGGSFNPWNTGDEVDGGLFTDERPFHHISSLYSYNISVDDVVITGVKASVKVDTDDSSGKETKEFTSGSEGYVIEIEGNDLISADNAQEIVDWLGAQLVGLTFRKADVSHTSDPSIEAGDVAFVYDRKGNEYPILITRTVFTPGGAQTTVCGASTPNRNSATRYSQVTKSYVANRKELKKETKRAYDAAMENLQQAIANAKGMYETQEVDESGGTITYLHDKPLLEQSTAVIMISNVGVTVTPNYQAITPTWYGLQVDGTLITSVMNTIGLNFDWGTGGTLTLGGQNNVNGLLRVLNASSAEIGRWDNNGITFVYRNVSGAMGRMTYQDEVDGSYTNLDGFQLHLVDNSLGREYWSNQYAWGQRYFLETIDSSNIFNEASFQPYFSHFKIYSYVVNPTSDSPSTKSQAKTEIQATASRAYLYLKHRNFLNTFTTFLAIGEGSLRFGCYGLSGQQTVYPRLNITYGSIYIYAPQDTNSASNDTPTISVSKGTTGSVLLRGAENQYISLNVNECTLKCSDSAKIAFTSSYFRYNNTDVQLVSSSSRRYKHDITGNISKDLDPHKLYELPMKQFVFNDDHKPQYADMKGQTIPGFIAEEVAEIYPSATIHNAETGEIESWDERRIIPGMLALIQEQKSEIDELKERVAKLESIIEKLL